MVYGEWSMNMNLLDSYDPLLRSECAPFDFKTGYKLDNGEILDAHSLFTRLKLLLISNRGLGLSASQLGIMTRVFVIGDPTNEDSIIPVFNPRIVNSSDEEVMMEEGCLSFPGLFVNIKRPASLRARFANIEGQYDAAQFTGMTARVFQHEYDHLDGIVFKQRARAHELSKAYNLQKKLNRKRKHNAATRSTNV